MHYLMRKKPLALALILAVSTNLQAQSLQEVLQYSLVNDPVLLEAEADEQGAYNRVEQAKSGHWPTVRLTGSQMVKQYHKDRSDYSDNGFNPGVEVSMNLYSFGAIESEIKKNKASEVYYHHKYGESQEELGLTIGQLYLDALKAKESVDILQASLARHDKMLGDLSVIVEYDEGRASEFAQARARKILVEQKINTQERILETNLSSLSKYTQNRMTADDLVIPFRGLDEQVLKEKYTLIDRKDNPSYLAQQAELESKRYDIEAERAKRLPAINLVGSADKDDRELRLQVAWDVFNRATEYTVGEKASNLQAAERRLSRVSRDVDETSRLALIDIQQNARQLETLASQIVANKKVVDFYSLQFSIARKTLLDVLNAESELSDVELAYAETQYGLYQAILNYLRSQGRVAYWAGVAPRANTTHDAEDNNMTPAEETLPEDELVENIFGKEQQ